MPLARPGSYGWKPSVKVRRSRLGSLQRHYRTDLFGFTYCVLSLSIHYPKGCANWPMITLMYRDRSKQVPIMETTLLDGYKEMPLVRAADERKD